MWHLIQEACGEHTRPWRCRLVLAVKAVALISLMGSFASPVPLMARVLLVASRATLAVLLWPTAACLARVAISIVSLTVAAGPAVGTIFTATSAGKCTCRLVEGAAHGAHQLHCASHGGQRAGEAVPASSQHDGHGLIVV